MKNFENSKKIMLLSTAFKILCFVALLGWVFFIFIGVAVFGYVEYIFHYGVKDPTPMETWLLASFNWSTPYMYWDFITYGLALPIVGLIMTLNLYRFFRRLSNGCVFDKPLVTYLHAAGIWCLALWICLMLTDLSEMLFFHQVFHFHLIVFLFGAGLLFIAWLLREAQNLQEEHKLTV